MAERRRYIMYLTRRDNMYNIFNELFRAPFMTGFGDTTGTTKLMKTDIKENDNGYVLDMELPGYAKEDIKAELKDGYLTVTATKKSEKSEGGEDSKFIRRERFEGTSKRSFYVGEYLHEDDIKAEYKDGVLKLEIPKEPEPVKEEPKMIAIQ